MNEPLESSQAAPETSIDIERLAVASNTGTASRSTLYVPGDRPDRFVKALASGADAIILDLEDAVAEDAKVYARQNVADWLSDHPDAPAWVRVNNRIDLLNEDLAMVASVPCLGIVMPKAEPNVCNVSKLRVIALIESARGVSCVDEIAAVPAVCGLALGEADLAADLGMRPSPDGREWAPIRSRVVVASAAAGLIAPIGPVFTNLDDELGLAASTSTLCRQGFGGRSAIHPQQVAIINAGFGPSDEEIRWADRIVEAHESAQRDGRGVALVSGEFVDAAVLRRAQDVIDRTDDE